MEAFFSTLAYILLFVVFLSILIMVHEAGHLVAAKAFNVYCFEYSIGFGPALFSRRRKNGETKFSIRAIPLGGYVSMYGETDVVPPDVTEKIDESRSLNHIKRWKRCIVLVAGVTMNVVISIVIFFIAETACTIFSMSASNVIIKENSIAYNAGLRHEDTILWSNNYDFEEYYVADDDARILETDQKVGAVFNRAIASSDDINWTEHISFVTIYSELKIDKDHLVNYADVAEKNYSFSFNLKTAVYKDEQKISEKVVHIVAKAERKSASVSGLEDLGISITKTEYHNNFGQAIERTFQDFGSSSTLIFRGLASLFTGGAGDVGGIIAVGYVSTNILKTMGWHYFLITWGMISVNLAVVNLFPFPGLDGWQLLVTIVEGITKKEIPPKVKGIVSAVGIILLLGLMVTLIVKDLFTFVF